MRGFAHVVVCGGVLLGCGPLSTHPLQPKSPTQVAQVQKLSPDDDAYAKFRAGRYPFETALANLQEARSIAKKLAGRAGGTAKGGFDDLTAHLDEMGRSLSEMTGELPSREVFAARFPEFDEQRIKAISEGNRLLSIIEDSGAIAHDLAEGAPASFKKEMERLSNLLDEVQDGVESGIRESGGEVATEG